jgi:RNA polymerase sigma-70 factor (ECF subfamily)
MGTLQASFSDVLLPIGILSGKGSGRTVAPCATSNEWADVQQAIAGDTDAQERLFARHTSRLYRTAFSLLRNKEDAEDAVQDGCCRAYNSLRSFKGRSSFSTWLTRIVINSALLTIRRRRAHPEASLDEIMANQPDWMPNGLIEAQPDPETICSTIESQCARGKACPSTPTLFESGISTRGYKRTFH